MLHFAVITTLAWCHFAVLCLRPLSVPADAPPPGARGAACIDEPQRRAFPREGTPPDTLVFAGESRHIAVSSQRSGSNLTITAATVFRVALYVDGIGAREISAALSGNDRTAVLHAPAVHRLIIDGAYPKAIVLTMPQQTTARTVRNEIAEALGKLIRTDALESLSLLNCVSYVRPQYEADDEIVFLIRDNRRILPTTCGQELPEIESPALVRAFLSLWIGADKLSGERTGLLSKL